MCQSLSQRTGRDIKIIRSVHIRHASTTAHEYTCFKKKIGCVIKINDTRKGQCHFRYYRKQSILAFDHIISINSIP